MADIQMPQLGETVTEGTITKWFKQVGEQVAEDEPLFEVSTDKVDSEVPSPTSGYLAEILVPEGETVDVGVVLARIGDAPSDGGDGGGGEAPATQEAPTAAPESGALAVERPAAEAPQAAPTQAEPAQPETPPVTPTAIEEVAPQPPAGQAPGADAAAPSAVAEGAGPEAPAAAAPGRPAPTPATGDGAPSANGRLLSPVVRRLISENNLDPAQIQGSGPGGRITRNDVLAVIERGGRAAPPVPSGSAAAPAAPPESVTPAARAGAAAPAGPAVVQGPQPVAAPGERDTTIPHSNMRRRTAEHMIRSKQTSAHVYASIEVDYENVERVRHANRDQWKAAEGFSLTYLPFIGRAVIDAIREYPEVNASFDESGLVVHNYVNLGIAVDLDFKGLMVPVIRDADSKRLRAISREVSDLAKRARGKQLSPDDIAGGTFTITNPGPFGTTLTLPIINQPQVAILSTDGVKRRPVVVDLPDGSEGIAIHSVGNLTLTWDHRAFDGAYAATFLRRIKEILETRDWSAELA